MSVRIQLDRPHAHFRNLDLITGKVILTILNNETISAVTVKLEGESKTCLAVSQLLPEEHFVQAQGPRGRHHAELEVHKLLYKVSTVFPAEHLQRIAPENSSYTLPAGQYEYPFRIKIPFNNDCHNNSLFANSNNVAGLLGEIAKATSRHVKTTLPPSLSGLPGQAEIRYFVKVTVQRPAFYKENFRATVTFNFLPIEPPRGPENGRESYARRQHQFAPKIDVPYKQRLFRKPTVPSSSIVVIPPNVSIDSRLPDPAIVTCNEPLPLRVLITKLNGSLATIYLQILTIELIGHTNIRAHQLQRTDSVSWVIMSASNLRMPLGSRDNLGPGKDMEIDANMWNQIPIPSTVAPSFETCNVTRNYSLDIKVGLSYGSSNNVNSELTIQTLRMPVIIYSGVAPPPELLARMSDHWPAQAVTQPQPQLQTQTHIPTSEPSQAFYPPQPQSGQYTISPQTLPEDSPPSYDDVVGNNHGSVYGARRGYHQQP
ncbi:hypothetical protein MMC29_006904 [Sticta canariensis]|nr:hypothetical protein [Sticta canariensis]